jgi:hypothetical protein
MSPRLWPSLLALAFVFALLYSLCPPSSQTPDVIGRVTDGPHPIAGARVRFQGHCPSTQSDADGRFRLPRPAGKARLTVWKQGFAIAGASDLRRPLELTLTPLPVEDDEDYRWTDPTPDPARKNNCGNCHTEIYREWSAGAHARSARNPRLLDLLGGTDRHGRRSPRWSVADENPLGSAVCALCHAPTFTADPVRNDLRKARADHGVHCDYCHKVADVLADELGTLFGRDALRLLRPKDGRQLFFGPLDDSLRDGEIFAYSPLYRESRYCAACHEGVVFGVHAYGTYSEWRASPAFTKNQHCQDCHMKPNNSTHNVAPGNGGIDRDPRTLASHLFPGGNARMLASSLQVEARREGRRVEVVVRAEGVGHRVPTGFPDRHLLLVVEAFGHGARLAPLSEGEHLPAAAGRGLAGKAGKLFAKQLQDSDGKGPVPFWAAPARVADTRLTPGRPERIGFAFAEEPARLRVRLIYRSFWQEVVESKGWPNDEITVFDRVFP